MVDPSICPLCGRSFRPRGRQRWCSDGCRQKAFRRRRASVSNQPLPVTPTTGRAHVVYECPDCEARYLGEQWCPDCQKFCRRVGPGGLCPCCDEPVAVVDLITPDLTPLVPNVGTDLNSI